MNAKLQNDINTFLSRRPEAVGIFGYGSGVNPQLGYDETTKRQIDLILAVDSPKEWHKRNMSDNPNDYAFSSKLFYTLAPIKVQEAGNKTCFLTYLQDEDINNTFKLAIIDKEWLLHDLRNWQTFYMAGRFQKPIEKIKTNANFDAAIITNRISALRMAKYILNNPDATKEEVYTAICSLSYMGDIRMMVAENPNKVKNIVRANISRFDEMYGNLNINDEPDLPRELLLYLMNRKIEESTIAQNPKVIIDYLSNLNKKVSTIQAAKGIFTTGPVKSLQYVIEKRKKFVTKSNA